MLASSTLVLPDEAILSDIQSAVSVWQSHVRLDIQLAPNALLMGLYQFDINHPSWPLELPIAVRLAQKWGPLSQLLNGAYVTLFS